ncbi:MAG TPA: DNA-binding protein [Bacteroidetes bacterium]|nr:DNA-binding protein [Bacteroidota bacterium]
MEVICIESEALMHLVREVTQRIKEDTGQTLEPWVDGEEAMKILNIGKTTLQNLRNSGSIRYSQPSRKVILYERNSLYEYLESHAKEKF